MLLHSRWFRAVTNRTPRPSACIVLGLALIGIDNCWAISVGQLDDFNNGSTSGWQIDVPDIFPVNQPDLGPNGAGDHSLWMATDGAGGSQPNLFVFNTTHNWTGDWTDAEVTRIEFDVQGPSSNAFPLFMRVGIVGPDGLIVGDFGDTYVTPAIQVPSDNQWHRITFDVLASDFIAIGGEDIGDALADVVHFRILHNPQDSFSGASINFGGEFYLDNIRALGDSVGPITTGDYNGNNVVDAADYAVWRNTFGNTVEEGEGADGNQSGQIDAGDYDFWRARFGNIVTPSAGELKTVPEPAAFSLFAVALSCLVSTTRVRRYRPKSSVNDSTRGFWI